MVLRGPLFVCLALAISACSSGGGDHKPRRAKQSLPNNPEIRACMATLNKFGARFDLLPDAYAGNCSSVNSVKLSDVGVPVTNLTALRCGTALIFTGWARVAVQQAAREVFGSRVVRIETMGSYACRSVRGTSSNRLSEHAFANAIDVSGFVLSNGTRIGVKAGWNGSDRERAFLRAVRDGACKRFQTVLSPDYNAAHHDHLHFDMGRGPYCR